jgi:hypothetical protein
MFPGNQHVCLCARSDSGRRPVEQDSNNAFEKYQSTVKADGDKLSFVADQDNKALDVMNPEALKGHEGHHVEGGVHVYADKNAINVMSEMLKEGGLTRRNPRGAA